MKRTKLVLSAVAMTAAMIVFAAPAMALEIEQEVEQEAESGDVDQSFEVFGGGDNSNQSVGLQGATNTGNAQSALGLIQFDSEADDFEFEDVDAEIDVSPESSLDSEQGVSHSATASR